MNRQRYLPLLVATLLTACGEQAGGQSGAEFMEPEMPELGDPEPDPQNPGSGGAECEENADCEALTRAELARLEEAVNPPEPFSTTHCEQVSVILEFSSVSGPVCECETAAGHTRSVGPVGLGCYVAGRGGECLMGDEDYAGCDLDDAQSCDAVCDDLEQRLTANAERVYDVEVRQASCEMGACSSVVRIDSECFVDHSYRDGLGYSCDGSDADIRAEHAEDTKSPDVVPLPPAQQGDVPGTDGTLSLQVSTSFYGQGRQGPYFSARADFMTIEGEDGFLGNVIDPLDGVDDCGVTQLSNTGFASDKEWFAADEVVLLDQGQEYVFEEHTPGFTFYGLGLTDLGVEPRYGDSYGFRASGGTLQGTFETDAVYLPEELLLTAPADSNHVQRGALPLAWTGSSAEPLSISLWVVEKLADSTNPFRIDCLATDDGEFTIPEEVMALAPEGLLEVSLLRRRRVVAESGNDSFLLAGEIRTDYRWPLGETCDNAAVLQACHDYYDHERELRMQCTEYSESDLTPRDVMCPEYLTTACYGCTEYFECKIENLQCTDDGLLVQSGCACD